MNGKRAFIYERPDELDISNFSQFQKVIIDISMNQYLKMLI